MKIVNILYTKKSKNEAMTLLTHLRIIGFPAHFRHLFIQF